MSNLSYHKNLSLKTRLLNRVRMLFKNKFCEQFFIRQIVSAEGNSIFLKFIPQEYLYSKGSLRQYDRNGEKFDLDISNVVDHAKYFGYRDPGIDHLMKQVKEDFIIVDIGANIGTTSIAFAKLASKGRIISFEPSYTTFERLSKNIAINKLANITAINKGIGYEPGEFKLFHVVETNPGMNRILPEAPDNENLEFDRIIINSLENELDELKIKKVNLIKIDVEGYEFEVIKGAENIITRDKPLLFIEIDDNNLKECGSSAKELINFLNNKGYIIKDAANLRILSPGESFENCHFDIWCEAADQ